MDEKIKLLKAALLNAREAQKYLQQSCPLAATGSVKYVVDALQKIVGSDNDDLFVGEESTTEINTVNNDEIY